MERFNGTVRQESDDSYGNNYMQAEASIGKLMHHYNEERLHAALGYMTPATWPAAIQRDGLSRRSLLYQLNRFVRVDVKRDNP